MEAGLGQESLLPEEEELPQVYFSLALPTRPSIVFHSGMCEVALQAAFRLFLASSGQEKNETFSRKHE